MQSAPVCQAKIVEEASVALMALMSLANLHSAGDAAVVEAVARAAAAAADKCEDNKCRLVDAGLGERLVAALRGAAGGHPGVVVAACAALRSPATADDARPVTSRCAAKPECPEP